MKRWITENPLQIIATVWRKPYHAPRLETLGQARAVTLGGSVGIVDFGDLNSRRQPGPPDRTPGPPFP